MNNETDGNADEPALEQLNPWMRILLNERVDRGLTHPDCKEEIQYFTKPLS